MPAKKAITTIGLIIIFLSLGIGGYFVYQKGLLSTTVDENIKPTKVRITNISSDSFTVSWITKTPTKASVMYGQSTKLDEIALDDRDQLTGQSNDYSTHHITLKNLSASSEYQFKLRSTDKNIAFDNEGKNFSQKTAPNLGTTPATDMINGKVLQSSGQGADDSVVYVNVPGITPLSALVKKDGSWLLSLSSARNSQLTNYANYDKQNSLIDISVQSSSLTSSGKTIASNKTPVPDIVLGQAFDFSSDESLAQSVPEKPIVEQKPKENEKETETKPKSEDFEPEESTKSGDSSDDDLEALEQFPLEFDDESTEELGKKPEINLQAQDPVIIDVPAYNGEDLSDDTPTFSGSGESGTILTIEIDGQDQETSITVDKNGEWQFIPEEALDEGDHVITLSYIDEEGEEATVEKSFGVVLGTLASGSGGVPKKEASLSATPKPTVKATAKPRSSMPSTRSGVPVSGVNFPTLFVLILGSSSLVLGLFWKKLFINQ